MRKKTFLVLGLMTILVLIAVNSATQGEATSKFSSTPSEPRAYLPLIMKGETPWKGVGDPTGTVESLTNLSSVSWFINWSPHGPFGDPRYVPLVKAGDCDTPEEREQLATYATQYPGLTWLMFNEPDISDQDNISYTYGAQLYDATYDAIKTADPTAKMFCCGTAFATTQWLEGFRQEVTKPVDGIHFHGYPCTRDIAQECVGSPYDAFNNRFDMVLMKNRLNAFYSYLQSHSEFAEKPVWLTEIGILSTLDWDTREEVKTGVMDPFLNYLENEDGWQKFERSAWFSTRYETYNASDLIFTDNSLTVLGERWNTFSLTQ
jgi:hypothetical protein